MTKLRYLPAALLASLLVITAPVQAQTQGRLAVSINPVGLLMIGLPGGVFSAEVAWREVWPNIELGLPITWFHSTLDDPDLEGNPRYQKDDQDLLILQPTLRYFMEDDAGWYLTTFLRLSEESWHQSGVEDQSFPDPQRVAFDDSGSISKLGWGFGVGWRLQSNGPLFWGAEVNVGRNFLESTKGDALRDDDLFDIENGELFVDVTFLRIGWTF